MKMFQVLVPKNLPAIPSAISPSIGYCCSQQAASSGRFDCPAEDEAEAELLICRYLRVSREDVFAGQAEVFLMLWISHDE